MSLDNKHEVFKNRIFNKNYEALDKLFNVICSTKINQNDINDFKNEIKCLEMEEDNETLYLLQYKLSIQYLRICSLIAQIIEELKDEPKKAKEIINYHIKDLDINELNYLGLAWYYDIKFNEEQCTLYSSGKIPESNWDKWIQEKSNLKNNKIKKNILQNIIKACREHINRGGTIKLISFSKCFGIDLFKYMYLDDDKKSYLNIVKNTSINILKINDKKLSIPNFMLDKAYGMPDFLLDFSEVRKKENISNLNTWNERFLKEPFISQKELDEMKDNLSSNYNSTTDMSYISYYLLQNRIKEDSKKGISSRINPVKDKEVIASTIIWNSEKQLDFIDKEHLDSDTLYNFELSENEFLKLIYEYYYNLYYKICNFGKSYHLSREDYFKEFQQKIENDKNSLLKEIEKIEEENNNLSISKMKEYEKSEKSEAIESKIEENKRVIACIKENVKFFEDSLSYIENNLNKQSIPVNTIMSIINWDYELSNKESIRDLELDNIYDWNLKNEIMLKNVFINIYKIRCKDLCFDKGK